MLNRAVHYEGTLAESGEVFDSTREDNTVFSFELGKGSVIQAWEIAVKTMKVKRNLLSKVFWAVLFSYDYCSVSFQQVGEVAKITCKPEYAYGVAGSPPDIPPE